MTSVIKTESTNNSFSANGGLILCRDLLAQTGLASTVSDYLPKTQRNNLSGEHKFEALVLGFQAGNDHLDDWDDLKEDPGFEAVVPRRYCAKSLGDYLRGFTGMGLHGLQRKLIDLSFSLREKLANETDRIIMDLDSTLHKQFGKKMEGVELCYKNFKALDSILAFDELGLQYWHEVRPGSTYTSNGSGRIIHEIFSRMPKTPDFKKLRRIVRADSGFFNSEFFNACAVKGCGFICAAKHTDKIKEGISRIKYWEKQNPESKDRIMAKGGLECEIGHTSYHTDGYSKSLRLVVIRAQRLKEEGLLFSDYVQYDYYAFVSNMGAHEFSSIDLIKLYRDRGNAENFIKEHKYGFDLKHYPCLKLIANKAFGLIAAFAYTLMRFISLSAPRLKKTKNGVQRIHHFAKKIRNKWLLIPAQVLRHAGSVTFRFNNRHHKEILYWRQKIKNLQFDGS